MERNSGQDDYVTNARARHLTGKIPSALLDRANEDQAALTVFYEKHFSHDAGDHFSAAYLGSVYEAYEEEGEEDGLGYYPDGVKRTLTDEQIAIFRHSEIQSLLRERRHDEEAKECENPPPSSPPASIPADIEDGELEEEVSIPSSQSKDASTPAVTTSPNNNRKLSKKQRKAQYAKDKGYFKYKIKPDLRKRTWDKVDAGMDSLAYDDESSTAAANGNATQRRRISYDDD